MHEGNDDLVTVVIPALNEEAAISACLESVLGQSHAHLEVLVLDGGSTDGTAATIEEFAARDPRVRLVPNPDRLIPKALNRGLAAANGRWLVRVDAHATVPADYAERLVAHLRTGRWGGVGGRKDGIGVTSSGRAIAAAMGSPFGVGNSAYHYVTEPTVVDHIPFGSYPVDLARSLGGWNERLNVNEDYEFDQRVREAGHELLLDPTIRIHWESRQDIPALWSQYLRYGNGKAQTVLLRPSTFRVRHAAAPALVAGIVVGALAYPLTPILLWAIVASYLVAVASASAVTARKVRGLRERAWLPAAFATLHLAWGIGFLLGLVVHASDRRVRDTTVEAPPGP